MKKPVFRHTSFRNYIYNTTLCKDIEYPCIKCEGRGRIYDPDDPRDVIEGNKMRRTISCSMCAGSGVANKKYWKKRYKEEKKSFKNRLTLWESYVRHWNSIELTELQWQALNMFGTRGPRDD